MFTEFPPALYKGLAKKEGNLFCSPFSIQVALGMALLGAEGDTRLSLADAIDALGGDLLQGFRGLLKDASPVKDEIELASANAIWVDERFHIKSTYLEMIDSSFGDLKKVDYRQVVIACDKINGWVKEKTRGKIDKLVGEDAINEDTRLILTNAIYFKGKWDKPFSLEQTKPADFYLPHAKVPMMNQKANFRYFENSLYQALEMPYKGLTTSMLVILPRRKDGLAEVESQWDEETYFMLIRELRNMEVVVTVPKFKISTPVISLRTLLASDRPDGLGAGIAFSDRANFTGISDEKLKIDDVLHKAFVDVGEEGTEAAAATAVTMRSFSAMRPMAEPKVFTADHPFLFIIRNRKSDTVLFQGRLADPRN